MIQCVVVYMLSSPRRCHPSQNNSVPDDRRRRQSVVQLSARPGVNGGE
jgi:hypothetical protein